MPVVMAPWYISLQKVYKRDGLIHQACASMYLQYVERSSFYEHMAMVTRVRCLLYSGTCLRWSLC